MAVTTIIGADPEQKPTRIRTVNRRILLGAWRMPSFRVGFFIFVALLLASAIYPELSSVSATKMIVRDKFLPPLYLGDKWEHLFALGAARLRAYGDRPLGTGPHWLEVPRESLWVF